MILLTKDTFSLFPCLTVHPAFLYDFSLDLPPMGHYIKKKLVAYEGIGEVEFRQSVRARRMRLQVDASGSLAVILPPGTSVKAAEDFLLSHKDWIREKKAAREQRGLRKTVFVPGIHFSTRDHQFFMYAEKRHDILAKRGDGKMEVHYPEHLPAENEQIQNICRKLVEEVLRREAIVYLIPRTFELSRKHGLPFKDVNIRVNKRRWGSCSTQGIINLNAHLVRLPEELIDYVILHELAHLKHPNHSDHFHAFLEQLYPGHRQAEKRLRRYAPDLF